MVCFNCPYVRFPLVVQKDIADYCNSEHNPKTHILYHVSYN